MDLQNKAFQLRVAVSEPLLFSNHLADYNRLSYIRLSEVVLGEY